MNQSADRELLGMRPNLLSAATVGGGILEPLAYFPDAPRQSVFGIGTPSTVAWVFAVARSGERGRLALLAPYLLASSLGILLKVIVSFFKVPTYRRFGSVNRLIVAALNDRTRHAAEDRLDY